MTKILHPITRSDMRRIGKFIRETTANVTRVRLHPDGRVIYYQSDWPGVGWDCGYASSLLVEIRKWDDLDA
jgi:hypothetical protein